MTSPAEVVVHYLLPECNHLAIECISHTNKNAIRLRLGVPLKDLIITDICADLLLARLKVLPHLNGIRVDEINECLDQNMGHLRLQRVFVEWGSEGGVRKIIEKIISVNDSQVIVSLQLGVGDRWSLVVEFHEEYGIVRRIRITDVLAHGIVQRMVKEPITDHLNDKRSKIKKRTRNKTKALIYLQNSLCVVHR